MNMRHLHRDAIVLTFVVSSACVPLLSRPPGAAHRQVASLVQVVEDLNSAVKRRCPRTEPCHLSRIPWIVRGE
jgi:hypothetical protein